MRFNYPLPTQPAPVGDKSESPAENTKSDTAESVGGAMPWSQENSDSTKNAAPEGPDSLETVVVNSDSVRPLYGN